MKIGEALIERGLLSRNQLDEILLEQHTTRERFGQIVIRKGLVTDEILASFLANYFSYPFISIKQMYKTIKPDVINLIPEDMAYRFTIIPIKLAEKTLTIAMADPLDVVAEDTIRQKTGLKIKRVVAVSREIVEAIDYCYHQLPRLQEHINDFIDHENDNGHGLDTVVSDEIERLRVEASDPPVVKYVHQLVVQAVNSEASDIHIQSKANSVELRLRVDGVLRNFDPPPKSMLAAIITRIKILSKLDITERRLPQDGRFKLKVGHNEIDIRVSCFPIIYGESIVMRLLNTSSPLGGLEHLGFTDDEKKKYESLIKRPYGLMLVTGPTGSGKTTTLYTSLNEIASADKHMITIEDPVEYRLPFLQQSQVHPQIGFDFARGLRSILRQDPDVIMVGEIRDKETAEIAI
ncbi:MAG: GspE/PulE family protein, partial [Deltaproteobacteria bacterium]